MEEKYYYIRDRHNKPVITVCLLKKDGFTSRGVSVCSPDDNPSKKIGREIALSRAKKTMEIFYAAEKTLALNVSDWNLIGAI